MPLKKATRTKAKTVRGDKRRVGLTSAIGPKATTAAVIAVMASDIILGAHQRSVSAKAKAGAADGGPRVSRAGPETPGKPMVAKTHAAGAAETPVAVTGKAPVATLAGCLEKSGDSFHLKDTSGADAPKARSWKSGFLKKGAATI